jgi:hypothetical protein
MTLFQVFPDQKSLPIEQYFIRRTLDVFITRRGGQTIQTEDDMRTLFKTNLGLLQKAFETLKSK